MFRVLAVTLVLGITVGQTGLAVCRSWCGARETQPPPCADQHSPGAPVFGSVDHCAAPASGFVVTIREDVRRPLAAHAQVAATAPLVFALSTPSRNIASDPGPPARPDPHRRSFSLRI